MATEKQIKYIESLLIDVRYSTLKIRNAWLSDEFGREIKYLDELTVPEASQAIDRLRDIKDNEWESAAGQ